MENFRNAAPLRHAHTRTHSQIHLLESENYRDWYSSPNYTTSYTTFDRKPPVFQNRKHLITSFILFVPNFPFVWKSVNQWNSLYRSKYLVGLTIWSKMLVLKPFAICIPIWIRIFGIKGTAWNTFQHFFLEIF